MCIIVQIMHRAYKIWYQLDEKLRACENQFLLYENSAYRHTSMQTASWLKLTKGYARSLTNLRALQTRSKG